MTVQDRLNKLQALLGRIQRNAERLHAMNGRAPAINLPVQPSAIPSRDVDALLSAPAPAPVSVTEPAPYAPAAIVEPVQPVRPVPEAIPLVAVRPQRVSTVDAEEIFEDDIVELSAPHAIEEIEEIEEIAAGSVHDDLDFIEEEEQPPVSSQRAKVVAGSMDEALTSAAEHLDEGRVVPIKTPPPESGPQEALPQGIHAPPAPDVDELLRAESEAYARGPTPEQLGETIDLEEGVGGPLELEQPLASQVHARVAPEELEMPLPQRESVGMYDAKLSPPPGAREELEAARQRLAEREMAPPPESLAESPYSQRGSAFARPVEPVVTTESPAAAVSTVTVEPMDLSGPAQVVGRPAVEAAAARFQRAPEFNPATFLELLDASLNLGQ